LPTLAQVLHDPNTVWTTLSLSWYDGPVRTMDITSAPAVWYPSGKPPRSIGWLLVRDPQADDAPVGLLCADAATDPLSIVTWLVQRWQLEVTFEAARRHLGVETQRQWSDNAIARTTPLLLGLFSWMTLFARALYAAHPSSAPRQAAWYAQALPTFSDALALVRQYLWMDYPTFRTAKQETDLLKIPKPLFDTLISTLSYAA
jgi:hypothetical protein